MCHLSRVTCHMSLLFSFFFGQSGGAYRWRVCYQRGLPRLVFGQRGEASSSRVCYQQGLPRVVFLIPWKFLFQKQNQVNGKDLVKPYLVRYR